MNAVKWLAGAVGVLGVLAGCGAKVPPAVAPVLNVYEGYNSPVPGVYVLVADAEIKLLKREVKTSSLACASQYTLDVGTPLSHSLTRTMDNVFATLIHQNVPLSIEDLARLKASGMVELKLRDFQTKLDFSSTLIQEKATAKVSLTLAAMVSDGAGNKREYSAGGTRVVHGEDGGSDCEVGALAMASAIQLVSRDVLEGLAQRLASAPELR